MHHQSVLSATTQPRHTGHAREELELNHESRAWQTLLPCSDSRAPIWLTLRASSVKASGLNLIALESVNRCERRPVHCSC
jgi:hypothetical protein